MKSRVLYFAAVVAAAGSLACSGEVVVLAQLEHEEGEPTPLRQLPVRALPYDRDAIFDELSAAAATPEPAAPDSLVQLQGEIQTAQTEWNEAEARWNTARDSLRALRDALAVLERQGQRGSAEYRLMFRDFDDQESRANAAERQMNSAFAHFEELQARYTSQAEQYNLLVEQWGDEAFASVDSIIAVRIDEVGHEEVADTTDDNGISRISLKKGEWWIYAYYELIYEELYWNVPVNVTGGDPQQIVLSRANAQIRRKY